MKRRVTIELEEDQLRKLAAEAGALGGSAYHDVKVALHEEAKKLFPQYVEGEWYKVTANGGGARVMLRTENGWKLADGDFANYFTDRVTVVKKAVRMVEAGD